MAEGGPVVEAGEAAGAGEGGPCAVEGALRQDGGDDSPWAPSNGCAPPSVNRPSVNRP